MIVFCNVIYPDNIVKLCVYDHACMHACIYIRSIRIYAVVHGARTGGVLLARGLCTIRVLHHCIRSYDRIHIYYRIVDLIILS